MFDNYVAAKTQKSSKWVTLLISFSVFAHVAVVAGFVIHSFWVIDYLPIPDTEASFVAAPPPPPPPPPAAKSKRKIEQTDKKQLRKVEETVQPNKDRPKMEEVAIIDPDEGVDDGVEGGSADGLVGGVLGGLDNSLGNQAPPPPPAKPKIVPQTALKGKRTSGEAQISPPDEVKNQIRRDGKSRVITAVKMCLSAGGGVTSLSVVKSSGYAAYDRKIKSKMRAWKYKPYTVNGNAVPVCTSVTFIYTQTN